MRNAAHRLVFLATLALVPVSVEAEEVILFKCLFDWKCDPNRSCEPASLDRRIKHHIETNAADIASGDPLDRVAVHIGDRSVSFLEMQISGAIDVTTIKLMNGEAVYSSHEIDGTTLTPQQYLGECIALPSNE